MDGQINGQMDVSRSAHTDKNGDTSDIMRLSPIYFPAYFTQ